MREEDPQLKESLGIVRDGAKCKERIIEANKIKTRDKQEKNANSMKSMFPEDTLEKLIKANRKKEENTKEVEEIEEVI